MLEVNKITAGIPGLSPEYREAVSSNEKNKQLHEDAAREALMKSDAAIEDDGGADTTNLLSQMGRGMDSGEVIRRLRKLNSNLIFEVAKSYPEYTGIYVMDRTPEGVPFKRHICAMQTVFSPEFSVRHSKDTGMGKQFSHETRGWRTVGLRLVRAGLINLTAFEKAFAITQGRSSKNWQTLTA